jgi:hypothetical protein
MTEMVYEGTWEEIAQASERFRGKRLRVSILPEENGAVCERPFYETATPEEWVREFRNWAESHGRDTPALSDEAISRESIYFGEKG